MADPLAPQEIARASFGTVRRGYEPQAVRGFLHEVSALVERLTRTERELQEKLRSAEARLGADEPDEARLLEVLGAETTRVLTSAHEAAAEIRSKSEESAERIISEATAAAAGQRASAAREVEALVARLTEEAEATLEAARNELELRKAEAHAAAERIHDVAEQARQALRDDGDAALEQARAEAATLIEEAQQQGREMVAEAQAVRERVLRDLAVRRKRARQQVEKLNAGRERLLKAYETVRGTIDEATTELTVSITDARAAASAAARRVEEEPDTSLAELDAEVAAAGLADLPIADYHLEGDPEVVDTEAEEEEEHPPGPLSGEVPTVGAGESPKDDGDGTAQTSAGTAESAEAEEAGLPATQGGQLPTDLGERRTRKGRRKKSFEGLPPSELTVLKPPSPHESVRILAEPTEATEPGDPPATDEGSTEFAEPEQATELEPTEATGSAAPDADPAADGTASASDPGPVAPEEPPTSPVPAEEADPTEVEGTAADSVFARLREQQEVEPTESEPQTRSGPETDDPTSGGAVAANAAADEPAVEDHVDSAEAELAAPDAAPFLERADAVAPIDKDLRRRLKRTLADEQNEVLDLLRRAKPKGLDDLLPEVDGHVARWAEAAELPLADAATKGAASLGGTATAVAGLALELAQSLTSPLRERIDRSFVASDGNLDDVADRVRALYREWKGQRLNEAVEHFVAAAYAGGVFDAIDPTAKVRWALDPSVGACPDCDDNVLAGAIPKGDDFPTGHPCAPAHPGCHCLVLVQTG